MENSELSPKPIKNNMINVRVEEKTFKVVMAVAHRLASGSMSDVVRLCIHFGMSETENYLEKRKKLGEKFNL